MSDPYIHHPLDDANRQIRLVSLRDLINDPDQGYVKCSVTTVDLDQAPEYVALSYACGDPNDLVPVEVDRLQAMIYRNLEAALRQLHVALRQLHAATYEADHIWIDCLCIKQTDAAEKSTQVSLMSKIYSQAVCVIVWLGQEDQDSSTALDMLEVIGRRGEIWSGIEDLIDTSLSRRGNDFTLEVARLRAKLFDGVRLDRNADESPSLDYQKTSVPRDILGEGIMIPITNLLMRTWWYRLWIRQEILCARYLFFMCGSKLCPGWHVTMGLKRLLLRSDVRRFLENEAALTEPQRRRLHSVNTLLIRVVHSVETADLFNLVVEGMYSECSLAHDRIFAFLAIAVDNVATANSADYALSVEQVYERFARTSIQVSGSLDILYISHDCDIASWIPDWRGFMITTSAMNDNLGFIPEPRKTLYHAGSRFPAQCKFPRKHGHSAPWVLEIAGFEVDQIYHVGPRCRSSAVAPEDATLRNWRALFAGEISSKEEEFWSLLTLDRTDHGELLTPSERSEFTATARA